MMLVLFTFFIGLAEEKRGPIQDNRAMSACAFCLFVILAVFAAVRLNGNRRFPASEFSLQVLYNDSESLLSNEHFAPADTCTEDNFIQPPV